MEDRLPRNLCFIFLATSTPCTRKDVRGETSSWKSVLHLPRNPSIDALHTEGRPWRNGDGTAAPNPVVNALKNDTMGSSVGQLGRMLDDG